jgi:hypothetical protein
MRYRVIEGLEAPTHHWIHRCGWGPKRQAILAWG